MRSTLCCGFLLLLLAGYLPASIISVPINLVSSEDDVHFAWLQAALQGSKRGSQLMAELSKANEWFEVSSFDVSRLEDDIVTRNRTASQVYQMTVSVQPSGKILSFRLKCWAPGMGHSFGNILLEGSQKGYQKNIIEKMTDLSPVRTEHEFYKLIDELPDGPRRVFPTVYLNVFEELDMNGPRGVNTTVGGFALLLEDVAMQGCVSCRLTPVTIEMLHRHLPLHLKALAHVL
eukprot:8548835-Pyramimonas_sp.AAC.3